jgi:hypothetical protein
MVRSPFDCLPAERQLDLVFTTGTFVSTRWDTRWFVNLYALPGGVYAEVAYDPQVARVVLVGSFEDTVGAQGYVTPENAMQQAVA